MVEDHGRETQGSGWSEMSGDQVGQDGTVRPVGSQEVRNEGGQSGRQEAGHECAAMRQKSSL